MTSYDDEVGKEFYTHTHSDFSNVNIRLGFIKKVYSILTVQLLITMAIGFISINTGFGDFQMRNTWLIITACIFAFVVSLIMVCCHNLARKVPTNYILLFTFTLCEAYAISAVCKAYADRGQADLVMIALGLTVGMTFALTLYAMTTKSDMTTLGGTLFACLIGLLFFSFLALFTHLKWVQIIISVLTIICFGVYLVFDTQLIMGGKRFQLEIDDYIIGALQLYLDIIILFLEILKLLAATEK